LFGDPSAHNFKISGQLSLELAATDSLVAALHIQLSVRYAISAVENLSNRKELSAAQPQPTYLSLESASRRIGESASGASMPEGKLTGLTIMKTKPFAPKNRVLNPFEAADAQLLAVAF
jgi:hypothetical protein